MTFRWFQVPANGDVINTEDSEEALEEKEFIETNLAQEYAVDILKSMIKREDNFQPKVSCKNFPCVLVLKLDFDRKLSMFGVISRSWTFFLFVF